MHTLNSKSRFIHIPPFCAVEYPHYYKNITNKNSAGVFLPGFRAPVFKPAAALPALSAGSIVTIVDSARLVPRKGKIERRSSHGVQESVRFGLYRPVSLPAGTSV
jgi:hypothetical protein